MTTFLRTLPPPGTARDRTIIGAIVNGMLDAPTWVPLTLDGRSLLVTADWLTIGGARIPMTPKVAQLAVASVGGDLPTAAVVVAIEAAARACGGLVPFDPWPDYTTQLATSTIEWREANIARRLAGRTPTLIAGCLKDVITATFMPAGKVVIFGALDEDGGRVQPIYPNVGSVKGHGGFFDGGYAHGVRGVRGLPEARRYPLPW